MSAPRPSRQIVRDVIVGKRLTLIALPPLQEDISRNRTGTPTEPRRPVSVAAPKKTRGTTHVSDSRRTPPPAFCKPLDSHACNLTMRTSLLPSINTARCQSQSFIRVQTASNHVKQTLLDSKKDSLCILNGTNSCILACRMLHNSQLEWWWRRCYEDDEAETRNRSDGLRSRKTTGRMLKL